MIGANSDPFSQMVIGSGPMSMPQITTNIPGGGPSTDAQTVLTQLPNSSIPTPIPTIPIVPPFIPRGSGPSMTVSTIPIARSQPQVPPIIHGHHIPVNSEAIAGPSHTELGSDL